MDKKSRKELIRASREVVRPMGAYRVSSVEGGHFVVGTSRDHPSVLNRHRAQLQLGAHSDKALQQEWDARGAGAIAFEVLDTLEPKDDPGYDPAADLEELGELWRERLAQQ